VKGLRSLPCLPSPAKVDRIVKTVFRLEKVRAKGVVNVVFVGRREIRRLHKKFLNERGDTDVIAFPHESVPSPDGGGPFGDIYVCVPVARLNARLYREPDHREITRLIVHGVLHLLGYSDNRPALKNKMWRRQELITTVLAPA
jgi:probable rRNA maturation factor